MGNKMTPPDRRLLNYLKFTVMERWKLQLFWSSCRELLLRS